MQIVKKNLRQGEVTVKADSQEDLWYLHQLIGADDLVSGKTERKVKIGDSAEGKSSSVKKTVFLALSVERVEFHKYSDELRVSGKVTEGPEDVPHGSYHTISVEPGSIITIKKEEWAGYQLDKLKEAAEQVRHKILVVVFDREEALFALLKGQGYELLSKLKGEVSKKRLDSTEKKSFYAEIVKVIQEYEKRLHPHNIIVASPSFWKEYLMKEMPDELKKKITLATCSDVEENAIPEVMRRPEVGKILESDLAAKEEILMDGILKSIAKDEACYGMKDCVEKVDNGAVKELLVSFEFLNKARLEGTHKKVERLMRLCEERGGKVHIISTEALDKKLFGLGGVAGVLRWKQG